jgi:hypothetical protein
MHRAIQLVANAETVWKNRLFPDPNFDLLENEPSKTLTLFNKQIENNPEQKLAVIFRLIFCRR